MGARSATERNGVLVRVAKWVTPRTSTRATCYMIPFVHMSRIGKSEETESRLVVAKDWRREGSEHGISAGGEDSDLRLDGRDSCPTLGIR